MQNKQHRPTGVKIIAILTIITGILLLLSGIALLALGALFSANSTSTSSQAIAQFFGTIFAVVGGVLVAIGIGYHVLWTPKRKRMGMDDNCNIDYYWNRDTNSFYICYYSFFA
jgi:mannose/fructose/N-acetylgalactosamine-specific phosphotransferase system component IIC